jgi:hypothetical protein
MMGDRPSQLLDGSLYERISQIAASLARVARFGGLPRELERMHAFLTKGLAETHPLWADVQTGYTWVHRAAHLLTNERLGRMLPNSARAMRRSCPKWNR